MAALSLQSMFPQPHNLLGLPPEELGGIIVGYRRSADAIGRFIRTTGLSLIKQRPRVKEMRSGFFLPVPWATRGIPAAHQEVNISPAEGARLVVFAGYLFDIVAAMGAT
jgi:hypothetical protein